MFVRSLVRLLVRYIYLLVDEFIFVDMTTLKKPHKKSREPMIDRGERQEGTDTGTRSIIA